MRYEQIEKFISEGGDLEELIIDQDPTHKADYTFHYFYRRAWFQDLDWKKAGIWHKKGDNHERIR